MLDTGKVAYKSDIKMGERYRDEQTGFEGTATALYFFQHACERALLERVNPIDNKIEETSFDSPRLTHIESGKVSTSTRTGGPAREHHIRPGEPV
jgi:hypothetical protein